MSTGEQSASSASIAVLMPVFRPPVQYLKLAIASVRQQTIDDWELVVVDDAGGDAEVTAVLREAAVDPRVTLVVLAENQGISGASNAGLERVTAPLVALLDHDDLLEPTSLAEVAAASRQTPTAEVIYTDRDAVDENGITTETFRKPDWAPERLRGNMYIAHLTTFSTRAAREVGGFRSEFDGAQDHDLVLRITERGAPVVHIPKVLYHWRQLPSSTALDPEGEASCSVAGQGGRSRPSSAHRDVGRGADKPVSGLLPHRPGAHARLGQHRDPDTWQPQFTGGQEGRDGR